VKLEGCYVSDLKVAHLKVDYEDDWSQKFTGGQEKGGKGVPG